jgi:hypothetical protein
MAAKASSAAPKIVRATRAFMCNGLFFMVIVVS